MSGYKRIGGGRTYGTWWRDGGGGRGGQGSGVGQGGQGAGCWW